MSKAPLALNVEARVFFKHPTKSWVTGKVSDKNDSTGRYSCRDDSGEEIAKLTEEDVTPCREDLLGEGIDPKVDDLLFLTVLHDATLLRCLQVRYMKDIVYTNIGAIVVALNPFNYKIPWYKDEMMEKYLQEDDVIRHNLPHSWAVAHNTYYDMRSEGKPHTILVSGESGAGKTESCKLALKYLGQVSKRSASQEQVDAAEAIRIKILESSPILEGFGNAKTVRNNNSSRFGKFLKVAFHTQGYLAGAYTTSYLLEKSRIITAAKSERVYHAFYFLLSSPYASTFNLKNVKEYRSVFAGQCPTVDDIDDAKEFNEVTQAFNIFGINEETQTNLWKTVAGCLIAQNVDLVAIDQDSTKVNPASVGFLEHACDMWGLEKGALERELLTTTSTVRGETYVMNLKLASATDCRDSLCKHVYEKMFLWIIDRLNDATSTSDDHPTWIGVLDIFGFEDFTHNSFEQLCINLANETLQNHYNDFIFKKDMEECRNEGIKVDDIKCPDNTPCLRLISDNTGIMGYLDEECRLGTGTDEGFLAKVVQNCSKSPFFYVNPLSRNTFMVRHYAGNVTYTVTGFLDKNRDTLKDALKALMRGGTNPFAAGLLPEPTQQAGRMTTVGGFFRSQISELMGVINSTSPHWIRCIKPHPAKKPLMFDGLQVTNQLMSSGVLGTVKIRKAGFPVRMTYHAFLVRYKIIYGKCGLDAPMSEIKIAVDKCIKASGTDNKVIQMGKTRVFMKSEAYFELERARDHAGIKHRLLLQSYARGILSQMAVRKQMWKQEAIVIQKEFREYLRRSEAERLARRLAREKMLAAQAKERTDHLNSGISGLRFVMKEEMREWAELLELKQKHAKWVEGVQRKRVEEQQAFIVKEAQSRQLIVREFGEFLQAQVKNRAAINLMCTPAVEEAQRREIIDEEMREFVMIRDLFDQMGAAMFRGEVERMERRYRRIIQRLEDLQAMELVERMRIFPDFILSINMAVLPLMPKMKQIKAHAADKQRRSTNRQKIRETQRDVDSFSGRRSKDVTLLQKELVNIRVGAVAHSDPAYRRCGDKIEQVATFSSRRPWLGVSGVPDIDQLLSGLKPPVKVAAPEAVAHRGTRKDPFAQAFAQLEEEENETIDVSTLKRTNIFETFRDKMDETNFIRQRHIITRQFRKLAQHQNYDGHFVHETAICDRKTMQYASELLQRISLEFGEELVKVLRKLNGYCISKGIPEQHHVTGHWHPFRPVPKEMTQTYPPYTNWKMLLVEEKRLEYTIENFKCELLKILVQCEQRGARLPEAVTEESSVHEVHTTYVRLKGHFDSCCRCLFPMAPKDTLVHLRLLWPHVTDSKFPDRCRDCMQGVSIGAIDFDMSPGRQSHRK